MRWKLPWSVETVEFIELEKVMLEAILVYACVSGYFAVLVAIGCAAGNLPVEER